MSYVDYLIPGIIGQGVTFGIIGAGVATSNDMQEGVIDRFRAMPVRRLSIVTGEVLGQYCEQILGLVVYLALGLICGWRPQLTFGGALQLGGLLLIAMFAFTWMGVYFGMLVHSPDAVQGVGFMVVFPLSFLAGAFVPIASMAKVPRFIGRWDPISAVVAAVRHLAQGYASQGSWLLAHAELATLLWSLLLLAIFVPLALRRFNNTAVAAGQ
ncbi:MAG: ABC transporter permease [Ignavibacteriota bacterium]